MVFYIESADKTYRVFSADFSCGTDEAGYKNGFFNLYILHGSSRNDTLYVKGNASDTLKFARNDIICLKETGKIADYDIYEMIPFWYSKYLKYGDEEEREKFIRENFNLPLQYIDSVEESEAIIKSVIEVVGLWEKRSYYGT